VRLATNTGIAACEDDGLTHIRLAAPGDLHDLIEKDRLPLMELTAILKRGRILNAADLAEQAAMIAGSPGVCSGTKCRS